MLSDHDKVCASLVISKINSLEGHKVKFKLTTIAQCRHDEQFLRRKQETTTIDIQLESSTDSPTSVTSTVQLHDITLTSLTATSANAITTSTHINSKNHVAVAAKNSVRNPDPVIINSTNMPATNSISTTTATTTTTTSAAATSTASNNSQIMTATLGTARVYRDVPILPTTRTTPIITTTSTNKPSNLSMQQL